MYNLLDDTANEAQQLIWNMGTVPFLVFLPSFILGRHSFLVLGNWGPHLCILLLPEAYVTLLKKFLRRKAMSRSQME